MRVLIDDPYGRSSVNTLDFLTEARKAAMERGDQNSTIAKESAAYAGAEPKRKGSNVPLYAASALAVAVVGTAAGTMMMRGKQVSSDDAVNAPQSQLANTSTVSPELAAVTAAIQGNGAAEDEDMLFDGDTAQPVTEQAAVPAARKASAVEAFGSQSVTLEQAAANGDAVAKHDLAMKLMQSGDKRAAAETMQEAAEAGLPMAQYRLAKLYERGEGVPRSVKEARIWTNRAAQTGNVKAMHDLAVFYAEGDGGEKSFVSAVEWFTRAANHGLVDSQYNLGVLYESGLGVTRNDNEAAFWFEIAGRNGDADAARRAGNLMDNLTDGEAQTVRQRAENFVAEPADRESNSVPTRPWSANQDSLTSSSAVQETQRLLTLLGYDVGSADGVMGERTRAAISDFQQQNGLAVTGEPSAALLEALRLEPIGG